MNVFSILFSLMFLYFLLQSFQLPSGSRVMPLFLCAVGLIFSLVQVVLDVRQYQKSQQEKQANWFGTLLQTMKEISLFIWIVLFLVLIYLFGSIVAIPVFAFMLTRFYYKETLKLSLTLSLSAVAIYYGVFIKLLGVFPYNGLFL